MKKQFSYFLKLIVLVIAISPVITTSAHSPLALNHPTAESAFTLSIRNMVQTNDHTLEFDLYLLDKDATSDFELAGFQAGILINPAISANGKLSASLIQTSSTLNPNQTPENIRLVDEIKGYSGLSLLMLASRGAPGTGNGTILSRSGFGDCITRIQLKSDVPFAANTTADMVFTSGTALNPLYATRVAQYISNINVLLSVLPGENAIVTENLILNPTQDVLGSNSPPENHFQGIDNDLNIRIFSSDKSIVIENPENLTGKIFVYDLSGREIVSQLLSSQSRLVIPILSEGGTYIVKIHSSFGSDYAKVFIR